VRVAGQLLPTFHTRKGAWLLALLILRHERPVDRLWLASTLWPDSTEVEARKNLRNTLYELRRTLAEHAQRLHSPTPATLSLDLNGAEVDLLAFDAALAKGDAPELAVRLYSGPLLEGCTEEWVALERERREQGYLEALEALAAAEIGAGRVGRGVQHLRVCVGVDPLREVAQRALMAALAQSGDYAGSVEVYRAFRQRVHETLQSSPASETTALYEQIRVRSRQAAVGSNTCAPSLAAARSCATLSEDSSLAEADRLSGLHHFPIERTSFIGREQEMAWVKHLLSHTHLLTVTGSGGCGKTRLSLRVASEMREAYPDGVWLVELASLAEAGLVPQTVASMLGLKEGGSDSLTVTLTQSLKARQLLIVLDNCEHLLSACAALASALVGSCPGVTLLVTSRERLGLSGEQIYRVPSLSFPQLTQPLTIEQANGSEAVRLFVERARLMDSDFGLTHANVWVIAQICRRLDGIPLAIELAAARVHSLSLEEIHTHLDRRFRLLRGGDRSVLARQQTLQALIDWSWELLDVQEKLLLARLSVFAGGWTLTAAEAVCAGEGVGYRVSGIEEMPFAHHAVQTADGDGMASTRHPTPDTPHPDQVLDLLASLVDKSLVIAETQGETTRYRLMETMRQYACERLAESEQSRTVRERHRDYFLKLAEEVRPKLKGAEQARWLTVLAEEHDNLRAAVTFCLEESEGGGQGLRLGAALQTFWETRGHLSEGRDRLAALLACPGTQTRSKARADALNGVGLLARLQGDNASARALHEESLGIQRELGNRQGIAVSLNNLGLLAADQGDYASARALYEESLTIKRELGDRQGIAACLNNLGIAAKDQGDYASARTLYEQSLEIRRELGDRQGVAGSLHNLGCVAQNQGDYASARTLYEEALTLNRELGNRAWEATNRNNLGNLAWGLGDYASARTLFEESLGIRRELGDTRGFGVALNNLGNVAREQGDHASARALYEESLMIRRELGDRLGIAGSLLNLGDVARDQGDVASARTLYEASLGIHRELGDKRGIARSLEAFASLAFKEDRRGHASCLWGAASALRAAMGSSISPIEGEEKERELAAVREAMGEHAFTAAQEEGRTLTIEQAIHYALEDTPA
jgi:predicted ATPase/DNA-binding SARP family transcriptional activator/Tfp pilus assembly protein PilF